MGASNPFANAFGPDMMAKLSAEPKFVPYLADPEFVKKLKMLQQNPNNMQMHLSDPRVMEVRLVRESLILCREGLLRPGRRPFVGTRSSCIKGEVVSSPTTDQNVRAELGDTLAAR